MEWNKENKQTKYFMMIMFRSCDILSAIQVFIASPLDANNVTRRKERKKEQQKRVAGMIERKIRNSTLWIEVIKSGFTIWLELETENVNSFQWCCRYIRKTRSWAAWRSDRFCLVTLVLFHFCYLTMVQIFKKLCLISLKLNLLLFINFYIVVPHNRQFDPIIINFKIPTYVTQHP